MPEQQNRLFVITLLMIFWLTVKPSPAPLLSGYKVHNVCDEWLMNVFCCAPQGFAPAITALGWYYEQFEKNYTRAVELWEQADQLENPDAALNLGVLYHQGLYPGQPPDKVCLCTLLIIYLIDWLISE